MKLMGVGGIVLWECMEIGSHLPSVVSVGEPWNGSLQIWKNTCTQNQSKNETYNGNCKKRLKKREKMIEEIKTSRS